MHLTLRLALATVSLVPVHSSAADPAEPEPLALWEARVWESRSGEGQLNLRLRKPDQIEPGAEAPLLLFLHGAGGRGDDNRGQVVDAGAGLALEKIGVASEFGAYVLAGQVPAGEQWVDVDWGSLDHEMPDASDSMRLVLEALDAFVADAANRVDRERVYVAGLSMGGYGTWDALQRRPGFFAAAVPICGGGDKRLARAIAGVPVWAWHGSEDAVISPSRSRDMVNALESAGASPRYTEVEGRGHGVWVDAFASGELWEWLFAQVNRRGEADPDGSGR